MPNYTVSDILGKGFKYEQKALPIITPPLEGTIFATAGVADWGPLNLPTRITTGLGEFQSKFGDSSKVDLSKTSEYSRVAMEYHLKFSPQGFFTRVANVNASKAFKDIVLPATVAKILASTSLRDGINIRDEDTPKHHNTTTAPGGQNNLFKVDTVDTNVVLAELAFSASSQATPIVSRAIGTGLLLNPKPATFSVGESISIKIDGKLYTIVLTAADTLVTHGPYDNTMLALLATTLKAKFEAIFPVTSVNAFPTTMAGFTLDNVFSVVGNTIKISSMEYGDESELQIIASTLGGAGNYLFSITANSKGARTSLDGVGGIIDQLNTHFNPLIGFTGFALNSSTKILLTANPSNAGSTSALKLGTASIPSADISSELGFTSTILVAGTNAVNFGKFEAFYTGIRGNLIKIVTQGIYPNNTLEVYLDSELYATFASYVQDVNDVNDLANLLSLSSRTNNLVTFTYVSGTLPSERIEWDLEFGNSGGSTIDEGIVPNTEYTREIAKYSNVDLFNIDLITIPGKSSDDDIIDVLRGICETRQDCFTVIDTPINTVLNSSNSVVITLAKNFADNIGKLGSLYEVTYFPYLLIRNELKNSNIMVPPSVRAIGTIAASDNIRKSTFGAPAGEITAVISEVEGLTHFLEQKDKDELYADIYNSNINPISFNILSGFFLDGNKTQQRKINGNRSPLDRINIMRTGLWIKKELQKEVKNFFYEPTDPLAWNEFAKLIRAKMNLLVDKRAIQSDFVVICDSSLNTEVVVNQNGMIAKIDWRPINVIERIKMYSTILNQTVTITPAS
jgi:hypothetical protein